MTVTRKDIRDRAKALQDALGKFQEASKTLNKALAEAERERNFNNVGSADNMTREAQKAFRDATAQISQTISDSQKALNAALDGWRTQADPSDPLISQAVAMLGATGKQTPKAMVDALISRATMPYQLAYLWQLFEANGMTAATIAARDRYQAMTPGGFGSDLGTAAYIANKHARADEGTGRAISDALRRCDSIAEAFAEPGDGGNE